MEVETVATTPYEGQRPGTSGLRKKVKEVQQPHYLENFVQCIFDALPAKDLRGCTLLVSGDGRFHNRTAIQTICQMAAANGVGRVWIGKGGLVSTPAASAIIREREGGICYGGILLTASHNAGGPLGDFGIKYNTCNGSPAPESVTEEIYRRSREIKRYKIAKLREPLDIDTLGGKREVAPGFTVEVIDAIEDWLAMMKTIFDFGLLRGLLSRQDFKFCYDGLSGVAGPYAKRLFVEELGAAPACLLECDPLEDFGGGHPDPNLTYAKRLVGIMKPLTPNEISDSTPDFGAAGDGDCDRNMILGKGFFVTPSDSVAIITSYAQMCIPYFKKGLKGVSRSMPTSCALDNVAKQLRLQLYEVPTGWKYFGNLMEVGKLSICGEESFGTGSDHIREKDGLWAVLAWLSIMAFVNSDKSKPLVSVEQIVQKFWAEYGRNYYSRYDYEEVDAAAAAQMMEGLSELANDISAIGAERRPKLRSLLMQLKVDKMDSFTYVDPVDGTTTSNQGIRCFLSDGSRIVWRLSGTGSVGATIRIYLERYSITDTHLTTAEALKDISEFALELCQIESITGRTHPTVIT